MWTSLRDSRPESRSELACWYRRVLDQQRLSHLSVSEVADEVGVAPATLYSWRRRLSSSFSAGTAPSPGLIRVELRREEDGAPERGQPFVVRLDQGRSLEVPAGFDAGELARVLEVLATC